jgi:glucose/arabinose dehydrogenase
VKLRWILIVGLCSWNTLHGQSLELVEGFPNLTFTQPVFLTPCGDTSNRLFVLQQNGVIRLFTNDSAVASSTVFLDISAKLSASSGEEGLLGLAFHPEFASNGYFYVDYTAPNPLRTVVSRFQVSATDPNKADPGSELVMLEINQPYTNHNGGMLAFGPDGDLYIGTGDGGSGGDPLGNGQNRGVLLGKILRIDINVPGATTNYSIPADNPFALNTSGYREEIWAYGLRNPWRFSFDPATGQLWAGDVGQSAREEIDVILKGHNYGWNIMEGFDCYNPPSGCDQAGLTLPIKDYDHSLGIAVTGGYVYRGSARPELYGAYIYGDYGSGRIWMLRYNGTSLSADTMLLQAPFNISSFGTDEQGELYTLSYSTGKIFRFNRSSASEVGPVSLPQAPARFALEQNYPNPFNPETRIRYSLASTSRVRLLICNELGETLSVLVSREQPAGSYSAVFDGSLLPSGIYLCHLEAVPLDGGKAYSDTKKLLLLR